MYITLIKYIYIYIFTNFLCIYSLSTREPNKEPDFSEPNYRKLLLKETAIEISLERYYLTNPEIARKKPSQKNVLASLIEPHQLLKSIRRHGTLVKTFIKGFDARKSLGPLKRLSIKGTGEGYKKKKLQGRI